MGLQMDDAIDQMSWIIHRHRTSTNTTMHTLLTIPRISTRLSVAIPTISATCPSAQILANTSSQSAVGYLHSPDPSALA